MTINIRGIDFQENDNNDMGLEFVNLSHRYGFQCPNWPYFKDVQICLLYTSPSPRDED